MPARVRFILWMLVGAGFALMFTAFGVLPLPIVAALALFLFRTRTSVREALGFPVGAGAFWAVVSVGHLGDQPCPSYSGHVILLGPGPVECGGVDGTPWLIAGLLLVAVPTILYWYLDQRHGL
jgi:hypothetical protein